MGDRRWGGSDTGGELAEYTETGVKGAYRKKERGDGQDVPEGARNPDESRRGDKGRDHIITDGKT